MFKLVDAGSFWWPVKVEVPVDGKHIVHTFDGEFAMLEQSEIDEILKSRDEDEDGQARLAEKVLVGWRGVGDADGEPIDFTDSSKAKMLAIPYVRRAVILGYLRAMAGKEAKRGN